MGKSTCNGILYEGRRGKCANPLLIPSQANDNKIPNLNDLESQLSKHKKLETIYLEGNPCQKAEGVNYRRKVMLALPQVGQIDATYDLFPAALSNVVLILSKYVQAHEQGRGGIATG